MTNISLSGYLLERMTCKYTSNPPQINNVSNAMFVISEKETVAFSEHFQCYEIAAPLRKNIRIFYSRDFTCYLPCNQIKPLGRTKAKYTCLRHEIDMLLN